MPWSRFWGGVREATSALALDWDDPSTASLVATACLKDRAKETWMKYREAERAQEQDDAGDESAARRVFTMENIDRAMRERFGGDVDKQVGLEQLLNMAQKDHKEVDDFSRR